jgi:hypothetical protein
MTAPSWISKAGITGQEIKFSSESAARFNSAGNGGSTYRS